MFFVEGGMEDKPTIKTNIATIYCPIKLFKVPVVFKIHLLPPLAFNPQVYAHVNLLGCLHVIFAGVFLSYFIV